VKLYIDTSVRDKIVVGFGDKKFTSNAKKATSQLLLPFINKILKSKGKTFKDVTEIEVATGPGSFTGLRIGVSVAQTLGWVLGIPVNKKNVMKGETIEIKYR
jgi:tRNA threonylcarbamoyladenosine biosynthesis protein TsaB